MNPVNGRRKQECRVVKTLGYVEGDVFPYEGYGLPEMLSIPLRTRTDGNIRYLQSGCRSGIVKADRAWYKLKGIRPNVIPYWATSGVSDPLGAMTEPRCDNELRVTSILSSKFKEFGFSNYAIEPAAKTVFGGLDYDGGRVCCAIERTYGDTRLTDLIQNMFNHFQKREDLVSRGVRMRRICKELYSQVGFSERLLKEAGVAPKEVSFDIDNYAIFECGLKGKEGMCIGRVDFCSTQIGRVHNIDEVTQVSTLINNFPMSTVIFEAAVKSGANPRSAWKIAGIETAKRDDEVGVFKIKGEHIARIRAKDGLYDWECLEHFFDAYDGKVLPNPIDKNLIMSMF